MWRILFSFILFALFSLMLPRDLLAAKKFVPKKATTSTKTTGTRLPAIVKYRSDKKGILLSFSSFSGIESVSYSFTYTANGTAQGIGGTISAGSNPAAARELLFGTCSSGVCTYHRNIKNATLTLTVKFTSGKSLTKRYRIKTYL